MPSASSKCNSAINMEVKHFKVSVKNILEKVNRLVKSLKW